MSKICVEKYIDGILAIYEEKPGYKEGHDGSDGLCDCIGMCRGGLKRAGAGEVDGMRGTNYAARYTILDLAPLDKDKLRLGDVVLKTRPPDDSSMPLPDRYRPGGADYNGDENNYTHIGTVTSLNPFRITHMTSPTAKQDSSAKGWGYMGRLPWVTEGGPAPEPDPEPETATVYAENGQPVKMRAKPSLSCNLYWEIPCGTLIQVDSQGETWSQITAKFRNGWMLSRFLIFNTKSQLYTVTIPHLSKPQADALISQYPEGILTPERG